MENQANTKTNTKAIVSLVLGIISLLITYLGLATSIVGIILSRIATREIEERGEKGSGLALGGLITSIVGLVLQLIIVIGTSILAKLITSGY
ncbi:DUF4190 domain-containing protein [Alloiococcus sp. CFN-8]|uniref:DUF4190 domain-containing protein n=1 Tax=Alloiococcus sp. CFN-8 TaxID=3416081 RepID=UPI003CEC1731